MNRRDTVLAVLALGVASLGVEAQQAKVYRIGYLSAPTRKSVERALGSFLRALRQLGWVEGQNLIIEYRWAEGKLESLPDLAADLVRRKVDLIVAPAGSAALAAKKATSSIPIVMIFPNDPVQLGLVASLSHPGGNVTGTTYAPGAGIFGKQLQFLKEAVPRVSRVAVLWNPDDQGVGTLENAVDAAAKSLGIRVQHLQVRGPEEFNGAFAAMARERAEALMFGNSSMILVHSTRIAELALRNRLPTMHNSREMVEADGLMAYAVNMTDFISRSAVYVDKILKGVKPADLPVEQPTKFELVINLKTAKALGLTIPQSLLLRADELIR